jgi:transcriptional regulator with XRE-family HTH domain
VRLAAPFTLSLGADRVTSATGKSTSFAHLGLGLAVRELRQRRGLTQKALAQATELHITYISGIEHGRRNPSYGVIINLSAALGVSPGKLVTRADDLARSRERAS